jgi:hypothetical protein
MLRVKNYARIEVSLLGTAIKRFTKPEDLITDFLVELAQRS